MAAMARRQTPQELIAEGLDTARDVLDLLQDEELIARLVGLRFWKNGVSPDELEQFVDQITVILQYATKMAEAADAAGEHDLAAEIRETIRLYNRLLMEALAYERGKETDELGDWPSTWEERLGEGNIEKGDDNGRD